MKATTPSLQSDADLTARSDSVHAKDGLSRVRLGDLPAPFQSKNDREVESEKPKWSLQSLKHAIAGVGAGLFATGMTHPIDVIKTRFQVQDGHYRQKTYTSTVHAVKTIFLSEGVKGFYKGLTPSLVGSAIAWGSYFHSYNLAKTYFQNHHGIERALGVTDHFLSGCFAGLVTVFITNPIWVIKTRMQIDVEARGGNARFIDAFKNLLSKEGLSGAYKGLPMSILAVSHGAIQFASYEEINTRMKAVFGSELKSHHFAFAAFASKIAAAVSTYPFQVVRSRLQQQIPSEPIRYQNSWDVINKTLKFEGMRGFYRGLGPNLVRVVPTSILTFVSYEWISAQLNKLV
eukprot:TRINITY_DN10342_c0_g1_i1.p1 TRINITY_DN10342_c0_g1~~TRINITY_DN10342_c0_g1_i1.p1  ORF type:complete len:345 (+),score=65.21 TRINITY_DN10342_c0_g1_i1:121-1155(+)